MEYIFIGLLFFAFSLIFDFGNNIKPNQKKIAFYISLVILIFFMGLRYRIGLDTNRYESFFYTSIPLLNETERLLFFSSIIDPGFLLLESFVKTLFGDFVYVQIAQSLIVNTLILFYFKRHTKYIFTCIFFYYIWRYIPFTTEEMRAAIAISIFLYAYDFIISQKNTFAILLALLAFSFHSSTIVLIPTLFLFKFLKFNKTGAILFISALIIVLTAQSLFAYCLQFLNFTSVIETRTTRLTDNDLMGQVLNIKGILATLLVYCPGTIVAITFLKRNAPTSQIMTYQGIILLGLICIWTSFYIGIFYRISRFFDLYFVILFAEYIGIKTDVDLFISNKKPFIQYLYFVPFLFFALSTYQGEVKNTDLRVLSRIYPYETVFTKKLDYDRERLFRLYNVYYREY